MPNFLLNLLNGVGDFDDADHFDQSHRIDNMTHRADGYKRGIVGGNWCASVDSFHTLESQCWLLGSINKGLETSIEDSINPITTCMPTDTGST